MNFPLICAATYKIWAVMKEQPCPWGVFPSAPDILPTNHPLTLAKLSGWVTECATRHECGHPQEPEKGQLPPLPSRVLYIGSFQDDVRLVLSAGARANYACLSHCWGASQLLKTTKSSLDKHLERIPWNDMPRTFRDAIAVTRYLRLQYLWIDSLCIIQDDREDWKTESASMANIYANSFLTIAATSAMGAASGFLTDAGNILAQVADGGGGGNGDKGYDVRVRADIHHPLFEGSTDGRGRNLFWSLDHWPLLKRGWIFQERMLSPRVLHMGRPEMIWECNKEMKCECGVLDSNEGQKAIFWKKIASLRSSLSFEEHIPSANSFGDDGPPDEFDSLWWDIIRTYTHLDLTYHSDKLPALSGLTKIMKSARPRNEYLAGLWSDKLLPGLLWRAAASGSMLIDGGGPPVRFRFVRASSLTDWRGPDRLSLSCREPLWGGGEGGPPSWSWASQPRRKILHSTLNR